MIDITTAIKSLRPTAEFVVHNNSVDEIVWLSCDDVPSSEDICAEIDRLKIEMRKTEYQRQRAAEYPDFRNYLDGLVKGDDEQMQAYIDACMAVKAKYPKPEEL